MLHEEVDGRVRTMRMKPSRSTPDDVRPPAPAARPILALCASIALVGCGGGGPLDPLDELPRPLTSAEREVVDAGNGFALELFERLTAGEPTSNVVASPLSAFYSLGMTANGAAGETLGAMRSTLGQAGLDEAEANEAYRGLMDLLLGLDPGVELRLANSIWYREGFRVRTSFVDLSQRVFDAEVRGLDFGAAEAPATINGWVEEETEGRIQELVESIRPDEVMFLINAVYFHGRWRETFDGDLTRAESFRRLDGSTVQAQMMKRPPSTVRHLSGQGFHAIELPYGRGAFVMTILLPSEGTSPADLLAGTDAATWEAWMAGFAEQRMAVEIPRFRIEWEKLLNDELIAMGMGPAFTPGGADFGRLVEEGTIPGTDLYITRVKQKAFIDVDEEGTEAAAATSTGVGVVSAPPTFRADRPFLFAIRERFSDALLFVGQVLDPTAG